MEKELKNIDLYLNMTGQTLEYIMSGAMHHGWIYIEKLAEQALSQKKRIVWKTKLIDGEDIGLSDYELMPIKQNKK